MKTVGSQDSPNARARSSIAGWSDSQNGRGGAQNAHWCDAFGGLLAHELAKRGDHLSARWLTPVRMPHLGSGLGGITVLGRPRLGFSPIVGMAYGVGAGRRPATHLVSCPASAVPDSTTVMLLDHWSHTVDRMIGGLMGPPICGQRRVAINVMVEHANSPNDPRPGDRPRTSG